MKALIQRTFSAQVTVDETIVGKIDSGLVVFLGVEKGDTENSTEKLVERVLNYRVFSDADDKLNLSLKDVKGQLLVVSQFTLAANTSKGRRPGFDTAADSELGKALYDQFITECRMQGIRVSSGRFGDHMVVSLANDGPVTFLLEAQ